MPRIHEDRSWRALREPGETTDYAFDLLPVPEVDGGPFEPALAALASECARLAYQDSASVRAAALALGGHLGLREMGMIETSGTSCLVVVAEALELTIVAYRGTDEPSDWIRNLSAILSRWKPGGYAHRGFKRAWYSIAPELASTLAGLPHRRLVCGHSLGGALAVLEASQRGAQTVYTFGAPRPGTASLHATLEGIPHVRIVNDQDLVPELPTAGPPFYFEHGGQRVLLDAAGAMSETPHSLTDRARAVFAMLADRRAWRNLAAIAPAMFSDHAPVNYSAKLLRLAELS